jgi:hypothetical protein
MSSAIERMPLLASVLGALACGGSSSAPAKSCFLGDASKPAELEVVYRTADGMTVSASDMATIPLIQPPQGGKVLFVGARARNVDGCGLTLATALVDPGTGAVVSLERRPVTLEPTGDGWMRPKRPTEASNYSNLPACPRADIDRSIEGEVYELRVSISDSAGRKAQTSIRVIPTCGEPELAELCHCECSKDYRLGAGCTEDAGATP